MRILFKRSLKSYKAVKIAAFTLWCLMLDTHGDHTMSMHKRTIIYWQYASKNTFGSVLVQK